jgi:hypothetical protein
MSRVADAIQSPIFSQVVHGAPEPKKTSFFQSIYDFFFKPNASLASKRVSSYESFGFAKDNDPETSLTDQIGPKTLLGKLSLLWKRIFG